ncbi:hypothetical protein ACN47E_003571 [Coniothyrium glycines]
MIHAQSFALRQALGALSHSTRGRAAVLTARRCSSTFTQKLADPARRLQSYISKSSDPFLNLSIEDHILRHSPADSTVLFLYVNRPCVVIGRNQNPWTEVNLGILNATCGAQHPQAPEPPAIGAVDLVRRRSGGGTVFHDEGNVNWSITCPRAAFTRDKHAEMTVRALRKLGIERARVNERHDIVLDQGFAKHAADPKDTHRTPYTVDDGTSRPLKVSGSAYKLTRQRALHHATTLLSSPNLHVISDYLRSPAKKYIQAKGVESVSSPVANIGLGVGAFQECLQEEFRIMYANEGEVQIVATVGDEMLDIAEIRKGYDELKTEDWTWLQTPQFDLSLDTLDGTGVDMNVHHGIIKSLAFKDARISEEHQELIRKEVVSQKLHDIRNWALFLQGRLGFWNESIAKLSSRLDELMPIPDLKR